MGGIDGTGHGLLVTVEGVLKELLRGLQSRYHTGPVVILDSIHHFASHLTIGDIAFRFFPVVGQIAQMDKHRQHVIFAADDGHVILEFGRVHLASSTGQHADDVVLQALVVHLDVVGHGIIGSRRGPVALAALVIEGLHDAVRIEHRGLAANLVAVVPLLQFVEVHTVLFGQGTYLVLGETVVLRQGAGLDHRVLKEVVQGRLGLVLLDWQNARHIDAGECSHAFLTFEHAAQPADVGIHGLCTWFELATDGIPLVDDEDERFTCLL